MPPFLPRSSQNSARVMMFVDGENLAIRYGSLLEGQPSKSHVIYEPDVLVWSLYASRVHGPQDFIRRYYYTSAKGDRTTHSAIETRLREVGIEAPHVFRRQKSGRSKRVDITLATDMLTHVHRKNYDIAFSLQGTKIMCHLLKL